MKQVWGCLGVSHIFKRFQDPEASNKGTQTLTHKYCSIPVASGRNVFSQPSHSSFLHISLPFRACGCQQARGTGDRLQYVLAGTCYLRSSDLPNTSSLYRGILQGTVFTVLHLPFPLILPSEWNCGPSPFVLYMQQVDTAKTHYHNLK